MSLAMRAPRSVRRVRSLGSPTTGFFPVENNEALASAGVRYVGRPEPFFVGGIGGICCICEANMKREKDGCQAQTSFSCGNERPL